jgi:heme A synthase
MFNSKSNFTRYAWLVLAFNILVILWGAVVSSTGSGAGCGDHWPLCDGEVIPRDPSVERMIEFSHRATSGVALLMVFGLAAWAFRLYATGHRVRRGAVASVIVIIVESLLGAGLVLFRWTAMDTSAMRVVIQPIHMLNTLVLLGTILLTAWWASGGPAIAWRTGGRWRWFVLGGLGIWLMSATGSIISLGDLLAIRLGENYNQLVELLVRLRLGHPAISILAGLLLLWLAFIRTNMAPTTSARRWSWAVAGLVVAQWSVGFLNVFLLVPLWTQLLHLLLADLLWISFLLWMFNALAEAPVVQAVPPSALRGAASAD